MIVQRVSLYHGSACRHFLLGVGLQRATGSVLLPNGQQIIVHNSYVDGDLRRFNLDPLLSSYIVYSLGTQKSHRRPHRLC